MYIQIGGFHMTFLYSNCHVTHVTFLYCHVTFLYCPIQCRFLKTLILRSAWESGNMGVATTAKNMFNDWMKNSSNLYVHVHVHNY